MSLRCITRAIPGPSLEKARDKLHLIIQAPLRCRSLCVTPSVSRSEIVGRDFQSRDVVIGYAECCNDRPATSEVVLRVFIHHVEISCVAISSAGQPKGVTQVGERSEASFSSRAYASSSGSDCGVRDRRSHPNDMVAVLIPYRTRTDSGPNPSTRCPANGPRLGGRQGVFETNQQQSLEESSL